MSLDHVGLNVSNSRHQTNRKRLITSRLIQGGISITNIIFLAVSPLATLYTQAFSVGMTMHALGFASCILFLSLLMWPKVFGLDFTFTSLSELCVQSASDNNETVDDSRNNINQAQSSTDELVVPQQQSNNDNMKPLRRRFQLATLTNGSNAESSNNSPNRSESSDPYNWLMIEVLVNFLILSAQIIAWILWFLEPSCLNVDEREQLKCLAMLSTVKGLAWIEIFSGIVVLGFSVERLKSWLWVTKLMLNDNNSQ